MFGFQDDENPPPPPRRVSEILRDVVADLDEAIAATDHPELSELLRRIVGDAGFAWSTAGNIESAEALADVPELLAV